MKQTRWVCLGIVLAALIAMPALSAEDNTLLLRYPSISADHIAFRYAGDIWVADRDGSNPVRLTVNPGFEGAPWFSPDGKWIAFSGNYDGNTDVYVVSVKGGQPVRLTYHPGGDNVQGWTPDGKAVVFSSNRQIPRRGAQLFTVPVKAGFPEALPLPRAFQGCFSADGSGIAYAPVVGSYGNWKHYRGGTASKIWLYAFATEEIQILPRTDSNDDHPMMLDGKVYFLSDRNWTKNLFVWDPATDAVEQLTFHDDYDILNAQAGDGKIIYEQAGMLQIFDPATKQAEDISVYIDPDIPSTRPHFDTVGGNINWFHLSPTGVRALFAARGDVFTVPADKGDARNLTNSPGVHDRYPVWSPDGSTIAWFADKDGEYKLYTVDQLGKDEPKEYKLGGPGYYYLPFWDPDGEKLAYMDHANNIYIIDLDNGKRTHIRETINRHWGRVLRWSPDGNWLLWFERIENGLHAVFVYDVEGKEVHQLTDGMSDAIDPVWSLDGKYIYFAASTNAGLNNTSLDMSSYERPYENSLYMIVLDSETENPFLPESDEEEVKADEEDEGEEAEEDEDDGEEDDAIVIDFEDLDQRILALPVKKGEYHNLNTADGGKLFYVDYSGEEPVLMRFDLDKEESETYLEGVASYELSFDGKKLLYSKHPIYGIVDATGSAKVGDGSLNLSGMTMRVDPREEWRQIFDEAWRIERDFFYDPDMHGADWQAVKKKYEKFLPYVGHRNDLNYLLGQMLGELVVGHAYVGGGDTPETEYVNVGMLGADYEIVAGRYRFAKIYSGLNWNPDLRAPLTEPGVDVEEGEYLLAVNGVPLEAPANVYELFQNTADRQVVLTVNDRPSMKGARQVTVVPIKNEGSLRFMNWVEGNRDYVNRKTNGRVAYVYMPNTAWQGYLFFNRYYFSQLDKDAVILDERFNGGGSAADYVIDLLDRPLLQWWIPRHGYRWSTPWASIYGPKTMLINEFAGSGGDAMPYYFRKRGLGKLIGKRTWGGLVGVSGTPQLMDGGFFTAPSFAILSEDNEWVVENAGVAPDIEVEMIPKEVNAGKDPQLDKAIEVMLEALEDYTPPEPDVPAYPKRAVKPK